jgi:sugar lactone lactonase YvrE
MKSGLNRLSFGWIAAFYVIVIALAIMAGRDVSAGGLYVADASGNRTVRFATKLKNGEAESLVLGQPDFTSGGGNGTKNTMNEPSGVIFQTSSNILWVADYANSRVLGFMHGGAGFTNGQNADLVLGQADFSNPNPVCHITQSGLCFPADVASDSAGNLWVADQGSSRVLEYKPPFSSGENASVEIGQTSFTSTPMTCDSPADNDLCGPWSLAFDPSGNLWVLDGANNRILEYKPPFTNGESASVVLGQPDFTHSPCKSTQSGICPNEGGQVRSDRRGNIWEADTTDNRVLEFPKGSGFANGENASVVIGQPDFTSHAGATSRNGLSFPWGIIFDSKGNLYVSEVGNCRVLEFKQKKKKFHTDQNAALVLGQTNFTTGSCSVSQTTLQNPRGIGFGP